MMLQAFRQNRVDPVGNLRDQRRLGSIGLRGTQCFPYLDDPLVDVPDPVDKQAKQPSDRSVDDETRRDCP